MAHFYPKALVRITATVQLSRTSDKLKTVTFVATPRSVKIDRNDYNQADECTLEFAAVKFPVLPRMIRQVLVQVYLGDVGGLSETLDDIGQSKFLMFLGYVDDPELALSESDGTIRWKARDFTALFLDTKRVSVDLVPYYSDDLDVALRRIIDALPGGENMRMRLEIGGVEELDWPRLADAAPAGLSGAQVPWKPDDTLWHLVKRACDPLGLIPSIELDELVVRESRGIATPAQRAVFVYGGNLVDYKERRSLLKLREGIGLTAYDLTTKTFITAVYPPAGDQAIAKKAPKTVTSKGGKKTKPTTFGANATVVGKDDKRRWFPYGMVANEEALQTAAQRLYEGRSRQEFEGTFSCVRMTAPALGRGNQLLPNVAFDLLDLTSGDRIIVDVLPEQRELLDGATSTEQRIAILERNGYQRAVATVLVRGFETGVSSGLEVYVRSAVFTLSDTEGFKLDVRFEALLSAGS